VRSAKIAYLEEQLRGEEAVDDILRDEADAWTNLVNSYRRVEAARSSLDIARENLDMSIFSYGEGMTTILDVLQAQISWLQIYENVVAAYYDYAMARVAYDYATAQCL
jgi:outer membrane protein TolC